MIHRELAIGCAALALACGVVGCGPSGTADAGTQRSDAASHVGMDAGTTQHDAGGAQDAAPMQGDAGPTQRDAGPMQHDAGPVEMGTHVSGGLGPLGGTPSGGAYRVEDEHFEYAGHACGGSYCVFGGLATGRGLTGAP